MRKRIIIFLVFASILLGQTASIPNTVAFVGENVFIPVIITDVVELEGLEFTVQYDETVLTAASTSFENTELDGMNFNATVGLDNFGEIMVVAFAGGSLYSGSGTLLIINFDVIGELLESTNLTFTSIEINNNSILESVLNGSVIVHQSGCGDVNACNYDADYTGSSDVCIYENDCAGVCGGTAEFDDCNSPVCSGGITGLTANATCTDCNGNVNGNAIADCNDVCEGTAELDDCILSVCSGGNTGLIANFSCTDCNNVINGFAEIDGCGNCVGGDTELVACPLDCNDVYGGIAEYDDCTNFVCTGGDTGLIANATCTDCNGNVNGNAIVDECSVCGGDNSTCLDCADVPNGVALIDECDVCNEPICHSDGVPSPFTPGKNPCDSGFHPISPLWNLTCLDCEGIPNGNTIEDDCGECGGNKSSCTGCMDSTADNFDAEVTISCENNDCCSFSMANDLISPFEFKLLPNYPNPFNPSTTINYSIATFSTVNISIYSMNGELIQTLVHSSQQPGQYAVQWNASNFPSGLYFVKLISEDKVAEQKVLVIK